MQIQFLPIDPYMNGGENRVADEWMPDAENQEDLEFEVVTDTYTSSAEVRRRSAGAAVARTGRTATNVNGTGEFVKLVTAAGEKVSDLMTFKFGANGPRGLVAAYLAKEGEPGAATVKLSKDKTVISFHLGHIFDKHPSLRPAGDTFCGVKLSRDKKGKPCVIINLRGAAIRKGRTDSDGSAPSAKAK